MILTTLRLRTVLDSRGEPTVEAELELDGEYAGRGSSARAIAPGRLELARADHRRLGAAPLPVALSRLVGRRFAGQRELDAELDRSCRAGGLGADLSVAVSVAHARALAAAERRPLALLLADLAGTEPRIPRLLVNVFSGGIHGAGAPSGFQQAMALPAAGSLGGDVEVARRVFAAAERLCLERFGRCALSDSSGLLAPIDSAGQLELLDLAIEEAGCRSACAVGVDVAAEHLLGEDGRYRLGEAALAAEELSAFLLSLVDRHDLRYVEDPFDPAHTEVWRAFRDELPDSVAVVGDDVFAGSAARLDPRLADGVLLKPTQAGTVTGLLDTAAAARSRDMLLALSHRSGETDDTAISDLAVALGADLLKVGGPRRGDRLGNYNQLLRLADLVPAQITPRPVPAHRP
jgi:enolase